MRGASAILSLSLLLASGCDGRFAEPSGPMNGSSFDPSNPGSNGGGSGDGSGAGGGGFGGSNAPESCTAEPIGANVALRPLTRRQYENSIRDLFGGAVAPSARYPQPTGAAKTGFVTDVELNALGGGTAEILADAADEVALSVLSKLSSVLPCAGDANRACAEQFVDTYARRAFRRPLSDDQRSALLALYDGGMAEHGDFDVAIAEVTSAILQRPEFVYLPEIGEAVADGVRKLDDFELASRLSYLFWDTMPDAELLSAAERGELSTPDGLRAQAERLVADARFDVVVADFVRQWAEIKSWGASDKDPSQFPMWNDTLARSIQEELGRFVADVFRQGPGGFDSFFASRETFVNQPLAELYGLSPDVSSGVDDWQRVVLPEERAGLLTRAALLSGLAGSSAVSHVKRGKFVRVGLLCTELGAPPANAQAMQPAYPPEATTRRQKSGILQSVPQCGGCHVQMDRIGLALDDFDAIGRKLDGEVDVSGEIIGSGDMAGPFEGSTELAEKLADSEIVRDCVVKHWFRYGFGRLEDRLGADQCTMAPLAAELEATEGDLGAMVASLATTDGFRFRKLTKESP